MSSSEDITKLPKWAQRKIRILEDKVDSLNDALTLHDVQESDVEWTSTYDGKWHGLPKRSTVRFKIPRGWVDVNVRNGMAEIIGMFAFNVQPSASNHITIVMRD